MSSKKYMCEVLYDMAPTSLPAWARDGLSVIHTKLVSFALQKRRQCSVRSGVCRANTFPLVSIRESLCSHSCASACRANEGWPLEYIHGRTSERIGRSTISLKEKAHG